MDKSALTNMVERILRDQGWTNAYPTQEPAAVPTTTSAEPLQMKMYAPAAEVSFPNSTAAQPVESHSNQGNEPVAASWDSKWIDTIMFDDLVKTEAVDEARNKVPVPKGTIVSKMEKDFIKDDTLFFTVRYEVKLGASLPKPTKRKKKIV